MSVYRIIDSNNGTFLLSYTQTPASLTWTTLITKAKKWNVSDQRDSELVTVRAIATGLGGSTNPNPDDRPQ